MLLIAGQATISLMAGWIYLGKGLTGRIGGLCLALSIIPLPCGITTITLFSAIRRPQHIARHELSLSRSAIFGSGGITHTTIIPRILPYSSMATTLICGIAFALPSAGVYLLVVTGLLSAASVVLAISSLQTQTTQRRGMIRLVSPSPDIQGIRGDKFNDDPIRYYKDSESMISSPCELKFQYIYLWNRSRKDQTLIIISSTTYTTFRLLIFPFTSNTSFILYTPNPKIRWFIRIRYAQNILNRIHSNSVHSPKLGFSTISYSHPSFTLISCYSCSINITRTSRYSYVSICSSWFSNNYRRSFNVYHWAEFHARLSYLSRWFYPRWVLSRPISSHA